MGWLGKQPCRELVFLWGWTETVGSSATSWIFFLSVFGMPNALHSLGDGQKSSVMVFGQGCSH